MSWTAQTVCTAHGLSVDDIAVLTVRLGAGITYNEETGCLKAVFEVDAPTLKRATSAALRSAEGALPAKPTEITVQSTERYVAETTHPAPVELLRFDEVAALLGISRTRVGQLWKGRADFPAPLARVGSSSVWTRASIDAYKARAKPLPPGRPRKTGLAQTG